MSIATCTEHTRHQAGCRNCQARAAERGRARTRAIAYGTHRGLQDPAPARAHVLQLRDHHGMSGRRIAEKAGVSKEVVRKLITDGTSPLHPRTYDAIVAVKPDPPVIRSTDLVPSLGAARRLQALTARGHRLDKLATEIGARPQETSRWRRMYRPMILASTDQAIRAAYARLASVDGGDDHARALAAAEQWAPPAAWEDDEAMDNPDARPDMAAARDLIGEVLAGRRTVDALPPADRRRVVEYLIALRYSDRQIFERLGWPGGPRNVAQYRRWVGLPPGRTRGESKWAGRHAQERRRERYRRMSLAEKTAAIDRFDFDSEPLTLIARAVGCAISTVESRRAARARSVDADADPVSVERAMEGKLPFSDLNSAEKVLLFETYGGTRTVTDLAAALRISTTACREWMSRVAGANEEEEAA